MRELIVAIQTTWPEIRIALYRRDDGKFQYFEQFLRNKVDWKNNNESVLFDDAETAHRAMTAYAYDYELT